MARHSTLRWEFLTTLDYEWSVIRGRRLCPWTIWVRTQSVFERHVAYLEASDINPLHRFILLRVW